METFFKSRSSWIASFIHSDSDVSTFEGFTEDDLNNDVARVHDFLNITHNKNSVTIDVDLEKFEHVSNIISRNLILIKSDEQNGSIFKSNDFNVTVTVYKTTHKVHIQGQDAGEWLSVFLRLCEEVEQTDVKMVYQEAHCSTPKTHYFSMSSFDSSIIDASLIESSSEIVLLKDEISKLRQQVNDLQNRQKDCKSVSCQTDEPQEKSTANFECLMRPEYTTVENQTEAHIVQTDHAVTSSNCLTSSLGKHNQMQQTALFHLEDHTASPTVSTSCQTTRETDKESTESNQSDSVIIVNHPDDTASADLPQIQQQQKQKQKQQKQPANEQATAAGHSQNSAQGPTSRKTPISPSDTLIIGSSIVKNIRRRGLYNTDIKTLRGAKINDVSDYISSINIKQYKKIVLLTGGNDASARRSPNTLQGDYQSLLLQIRSQCHKHCVISICGLPPRRDVNVKRVNDILINMCEHLNLQFIPQYYNFFYRDSLDLNTELFTNDLIHINMRGTSILLHNINKYVPILASKSNVCFYCGEENHVTEKCTHGKSLQCYYCSSYGHKQTKCPSY